MAASSEDIRLKAPIDVEGDAEPRDMRKVTPLYYERGGFSNKEFAVIYGKNLPLPKDPGERPFTLNSTVGDLKGTLASNMLAKLLAKQMGGMKNDPEMDRMMAAMMEDMPLRGLKAFGMPPLQIEGVLDLANGHLFRGLKNVLK